MARWNGYPARMNFLFLFFPTQSATTSLSPISNNFPSTHSTILQYFFFSQYKWNVHTYTHTYNLESLTSPNEIPKKEKRKRKLKFLEARPIRSSPSARVATTLEDANRVQGLLEAHSAFTTFLLTCAGTSATRGTCFVGPAGFFHTPLAPSPTIHDHTLNFSPR